MNSLKTLARGIAAALGIALAAGAAQAQTQNVGTTFPPGFEVSTDASSTTGQKWIGFGGDKTANPVTRTPVIILHGNDGTPYETGCGRHSMKVQGFAQYLADFGGYKASELWALGWQGKQCDQYQLTPIETPWSKSASASHTIAANVPDLRNFVAEVLRYTGAAQVDIVAHGMGVVLAREWARQDRARDLVRRFVAIDGPNQGMIICSSQSSGNPWAVPWFGGFTKDSPVCQELGAPNTPFLTTLNRAGEGVRSISPVDTLVIRNDVTSFPYMPGSDGYVTTARESLDMYDQPVNLSASAMIRGAKTLTFSNQGQWDDSITVTGLGPVTTNSAHVGIANSPHTWAAARDWLIR